MIDVTMAEMENRFKADLNGWLEHKSKYSDSYTQENIYNVFNQTIKYYQQTDKAREALHNVIFQALTRRKDFEIDFDVPRFEKGLATRHYTDLVNGYQLHTFTKRELWKMDVESALEFLFKLYQRNHEPVYAFLKVFIPLSLNLKSDEKYLKWIHAWLEIISSLTMSENLANTLLEEFYNCIANAFEKYDHQTNDSVKARLQRLFDSLLKLANACSPLRKNEVLYAIVELAKGKGFYNTVEIERLYSSQHFACNEKYYPTNAFRDYLIPNKLIGTQISLKEYLRLHEKDQNDSDHEHVFRVISEYVCLGEIPNQHDTGIPISSDEYKSFDRLDQVIGKKYGERTMAGAKFKCVYIIRTRGMFWKSILKVVTQFLDLWISELQEADCIDVYTKLLVQEDMVHVLYQHTIKHVRHHNLGDGSTSVEIIRSITKVMETCLDHMSTNQELSLFRDHIFDFRDDNDNIRSPILGSTSFWNISFDREIVRVTNQITSFEKDAPIPEEITRKLIILSVVWPYEVVRQLVLSCIQNKNQHLATVPVLHSLGNLCILRDVHHEEQALLELVLKDIISPHNSELIDTYMGNITQFVKLCCHHEKLAHDFPLILTPNLYVNETLLCFKDVLNHCVLDNLISYFEDNTSSQIVMLRFALYVFQSFCESSSEAEWVTKIMPKYDLPAFLYCSPEQYLVGLTKIMSIRSLHDNGPVLLRLQDWESVLNCIERISAIVQYALLTKPKEFPLLNHFFDQVLQTFDWKSQLLWYDITRDLTKCSLKVPRCFFQITGPLDDLFECDEENSDKRIIEGFYEIFTACKISKKLTTELFKHAEQWTYNLLLLWNHPYDDTIVIPSLEYALHPKSSLSVSKEYPNLLLYFLGKLYDSNTDIHDVIKDYNKYDQKDVIPIIRRLSENGTRQYFIILYITLLLKNNMKKLEGRGDKQDNYYISCLIKVIHGMENWGNISQPPTSYIKLKLKMTNKNTHDNVNQDADNDTKQEICDNIIQEVDDNLEKEVSKEPKVVYYPLLDTAELVSQRALSIITFYHLCSLFKEHEINETQKEALERLVLLIMEGLIDMSSRQNFQRMLKQQPKSRISNWKKKKSHSKFVLSMRPAVTATEEKLLKPVIVEAIPNYKRISQALNLSPTEGETEPQKPQYLYFIN